MKNATLRTLDLRRIRHFVVLAETLNYRKASQLLHMTQPPLTVSIQKLEAELGIRLFERDAKGVQLTPSGQAALADARQILHHAQSFAHMASLAESGMAGLLRIGFVGSATYGILQRLIPRFRSEHPKVELLLREGSTMSIVRSLSNGDIDVGFLWTPVLNAMGSEFQALQHDGLVVALPSQHALAGRTQLRLQELAEESFIMYDTTQAEGMRSVCMMLCQRAGFVPRIAQEAIQVKTVLALVETGLGIALVPSMMQRFPNEHIVYRPLAELAGENLIGLAMAYRPHPPHPAAAGLRALARLQFPDAARAQPQGSEG